KSIGVQNTSRPLSVHIHTLIWLVPVSLLYFQLWKTVYINTSYMQNFILFENNYHFKSIDVHNTSSPLPFYIL
ncbi:unnamed protein product, partial [Callosobruchus maculatus]